MVKEIIDMFMDIDTLIIFMAMKKPVDLFGHGIVADNSTFSHRWTRCIACYILNAFFNIIMIIFIGLGPYIKAILTYTVEIFLELLEITAELW